MVSNRVNSESGGSRSDTLSTQVYRQIKVSILTCKLKPGQMVYESDLIQQYGVSKTPIREALKLLTQDRLIQSIPGTCYIITPVTVKDVNEIWEMRAILEEATAVRAARLITDQQVKELEKLVGEVFLIQNLDDLYRWYQQNTAFHLAMAQISNNARLISVLHNTLDEATRFLLMDPQMPPDTSEWVNQHLRIVSALRERDGALATEVTLEDMHIARPRIEKLTYPGFEY